MSSRNDVAPPVQAPRPLNREDRHELRLKLGAPILLLRNLDPKRGVCNHVRLAVTRISEHILEGCKLEGGEICLIPRIVLSTPRRERPYIQFPVRLAFAMSFHESQGMNLDIVGYTDPLPYSKE